MCTNILPKCHQRAGSMGQWNRWIKRSRRGGTDPPLLSISTLLSALYDLWQHWHVSWVNQLMKATHLQHMWSWRRRNKVLCVLVIWSSLCSRLLFVCGVIAVNFFGVAPLFRRQLMVCFATSICYFLFLVVVTVVAATLFLQPSGWVLPLVCISLERSKQRTVFHTPFWRIIRLLRFTFTKDARKNVVASILLYIGCQRVPMALRLYYHPISPSCRAVWAFLGQIELDFELVFVDLCQSNQHRWRSFSHSE